MTLPLRTEETFDLSPLKVRSNVETGRKRGVCGRGGGKGEKEKYQRKGRKILLRTQVEGGSRLLRLLQSSSLERDTLNLIESRRPMSIRLVRDALTFSQMSIPDSTLTSEVSHVSASALNKQRDMTPQ